MSLIDSIADAVPIAGEAGPNTYHCPECDREFEVDAPPSRVVCSNCRNDDVTLVE